MNNRAAFCVLAAVAGCAFTIPAQELRFREYGPADGLPAGHVFAIIQDRAGFIWLSGARGVFRFDGHTFRQFSDGVPNGRAHALQETSDGRIWVVTAHGVAYREPGADTFRRVDIPVLHTAKLTQMIAASPDGRLLLGEGSTLWSLAAKTGGLDIQSYATPDRAPILAVAADAAGRTWAICGTRLYRLDRTGLVPAGGNLPEENWIALAAGPQGQLAVRSETAVWVRTRDGQPFQRTEGSPGAVSGFYVDMLYSPEGDLLVNTTKGLAVYRENTWRHIGTQNGLNTRTLTALCLDREGTAWLGTASEPSLIRWDRRAPWSTWTHNQGLDEETVWGIARDNAGAIWAAGSSGVFRMDGRRFTTVNTNDHEYTRRLAAAPDGSVWALVNKTKVRRYQGGATQDFPLPARSLNYLLLDKQQRLWAIGDHVFRTAADVTKGNVRFDHLEPFATDANEDFGQASLDPDGRIYMTGTNGLAIYDPARDSWERLGKNDGLQSLRLLSVLADSSGHLWVSYRQLIPPTRFVRVNNRWEVDRGDYPLTFHRTLLVGFAEDREKRVWVTTEAGVFSWSAGKWRHYRRDDGLRSEDSVAGAVLATSDGAVWVGTTRGLAVFDNRQPALPAVPPPAAAISSLDVQTRDLSFGMRSLSYWRESEQLFLYQLKGERWFGTVFDSGAIETQEPHVRYANLPGGSYRLTVKTRNAEQLWSIGSASRRFEVPVPWYLSTWFLASSVIGIPALAYGALRERNRRNKLNQKRDRQRLEAELAERTKELAEAKERAESASRHKTALLAAMSEQVRGPMHAFMGLTQLALTSRDAGKRFEYLRAAHESSESLLATLGDLLDYAQSEGGKLTLHPASCDLLDCFRSAAEHHGIAWQASPAVPRFVRADRRRLRQVLLTLMQGADSLRVDAEQTGAVQSLVRIEIDGGQLPAAPGGVTRAGLRAALATRLIEAMGGRLETSPAGVVFTVPLAVLAAEPRDTRRVLLVEADAGQRRLLSGLLEDAGFAVTARPSSAEAGPAFPIAVLGDGADVAAYRAAWPASHIVAVQEVETPVPSEADVVLWSPVDPDELLAAVSARTTTRRTQH